MTATPKRRWYQFTIRTLLVVMVLVALAAAWWNHRAYCLGRSRQLEQEGGGTLLGGYFVPGGTDADYQAWESQMAQLARVKERKVHAAEAYRRAVWLPWERLWIEEFPPSGVTP